MWALCHAAVNALTHATNAVRRLCAIYPDSTLGPCEAFKVVPTGAQQRGPRSCPVYKLQMEHPLSMPTEYCIKAQTGTIERDTCRNWHPCTGTVPDCRCRFGFVYPAIHTAHMHVCNLLGGSWGLFVVQRNFKFFKCFACCHET